MREDDFMRKILILFAAALCALTLAGCKDSKMMDDIGSGVSSAKDMVESATDKVTDGAKELVAAITGDQAKRKALEHAGFTEEQITDLDVDLDRDGMTLIFEVDFEKDGVEYDYDVNAMTGEIISADRHG